MTELIKKIGAVADSEGYDAYVVGGYVRNLLLKQPVKDVDVMVVGDGIAFAKGVAVKLGLRQPVVYSKFGTAMLEMGREEGSATVEFVGARRESYAKESRNPKVEQADLNSDLQRRDFTINALAMSINAANYGKIIDRFGGQQDLAAGILKTPLDPKVTFSDDPLRMLRAIRFASQLNFKIDPTTYEGIKQNVDRIEIISQERITAEFLKILASRKPSVGLNLLYGCGLLHIIVPEIAALAGIEQQQGFIHKDVFKHTLKVVDNMAAMSEELPLRFAALMHDIGKPRTKRFAEEIGWTFYGHEEVGARMTTGIGKKMKLATSFYEFAAKMVKLHMRPIQLVDETVTDSAIRRLIFDGGEDVYKLMTLCRADITSRNKTRVDQYVRNFDRVMGRIEAVEAKDHIRNFQPPIDGHEIMRLFGLPPGREVGILKTLIKDAILDGKIRNNYDQAYAFLMQNKDKALKPKNKKKAQNVSAI